MSESARDIVLPPGVEREQLRHDWMLVVCSSARTDREAVRFLQGERRVLKKIDLQSPEDVRSACVMCAVCRFVPATVGDVDLPCGGPRP